MELIKIEKEKNKNIFKLDLEKYANAKKSIQGIKNEKLQIYSNPI